MLELTGKHFICSEHNSWQSIIIWHRIHFSVQHSVSTTKSSSLAGSTMPKCTAQVHTAHYTVYTPPCTCTCICTLMHLMQYIYTKCCTFITSHRSIIYSEITCEMFSTSKSTLIKLASQENSSNFLHVYFIRHITVEIVSETRDTVRSCFNMI